MPHQLCNIIISAEGTYCMQLARAGCSLQALVNSGRAHSFTRSCNSFRSCATTSFSNNMLHESLGHAEWAGGPFVQAVNCPTSGTIRRQTNVRRLRAGDTKQRQSIERIDTGPHCHLTYERALGTPEARVTVWQHCHFTS